MKTKIKQQNDLLLYRERYGLTQQHVAELLGLKRTTPLSAMEQGHRLPNLRTALKLAIIYRVPVDFLYSGLYRALRESIRRKEAILKSGSQQALPIHV